MLGPHHSSFFQFFIAARRARVIILHQEREGTKEVEKDETESEK